jgi:hypothetical protein
MQPTRNQVEQSLAALATSDHPRARLDGFARSHGPAHELDADAIESLPEGLLEALERTIDVRLDRLEGARARLEQGGELSADELADRIVGRLVCDRLR